jgi:hypothetical protein
MAADVTFFFDPTCPYTWRTFQWLREVTEPRGHIVDWKLMSLAILNEGQQIPPEYVDYVAFSKRVLRVMAATTQRQGEGALPRLFTEFGSRLHDQQTPLDDALIAESLKAADLPADLADAADDELLDVAIRASHDEGQARAGEPTGSPITSIGDGPGYFGPVVAPVPEGEGAEKLYDALRLLSAVPEFAELKRARAAL